MYDLLLVNGDSYSVPLPGEQQFTYANQLQTITGINRMVNLALEGSANSRIIRSTVNYILSNTDKKILCVLGLTYPTRFEVQLAEKDFKLLNESIDRVKQYNQLDWNSDNFPNFLTSSWVDSTEYQILTSLTYDWQSLCYTNYYNDLFMLVNTLESLDVDYFIFNAAPDMDGPSKDHEFLSLLPAKKLLDNNTRVMLQFSIPQFAEDNNLKHTDTGHMYGCGHEFFSNFLYKKMVDFSV